MTTYKVKTNAVFNGQPPGTILEVDEGFARKYEALKYLVIIEEVTAKTKKAESVADEKGKSAPKKSAAKTKPKAKETK